MTRLADALSKTKLITYSQRRIRALAYQHVTLAKPCRILPVNINITDTFLLDGQCLITDMLSQDNVSFLYK